MTDTWRERLLSRLGTLKKTKTDVNRDAGLAENFIHDIFNKGKTPSVDNFARIADAVGLSMTELYTGDDRLRLHLHVVGVAHEGKMWTQLPPAKQHILPVDLFRNDLVSLEVQDESFKPRFDKGDCIIGVRQAGTNLDNLIGLECIVQTADGQCYVKYLQRGSQGGLYTLRGRDPADNDVTDVMLAWAAPIRLILRNPN